MKTIILILTISLMLVNCSSDDNNDNQFVLDNGIEFNIMDGFGNDMLNSNTYIIENMKLYYLVNGQIILANEFDSQIGSHNGIMYINEITPTQLRVFSNSYYENFISEENGIKRGEHIAYLQLNENDTDTIKTEWEYKENSFFRNTKIWYNGEDKTQEITDNNGHFIITK